MYNILSILERVVLTPKYGKVGTLYMKWPRHVR